VDQSAHYDSQFPAANIDAHDFTGHRHCDCHTDRYTDPNCYRHGNRNTNCHSDAYRHGDSHFNTHRYSHSHADQYALKRVPPCLPL
jgi:hypothetical protein